MPLQTKLWSPPSSVFLGSQGMIFMENTRTQGLWMNQRQSNEKAGEDTPKSLWTRVIELKKHPLPHLHQR